MARAACVLPAALIVALAGCGGGSSGTNSSPAPTTSAAPSTTSSAPAPAPASSGGGRHLRVAADPSGALRFTRSSLTARAGSVSIDFANASQLGHNLTVQRGTSGRNVGATPTFAGGSRALTLHLKPGTYTFYCSVPGHRQAGMHGTLVVK
jgi:plastocyanin